MDIKLPKEWIEASIEAEKQGIELNVIGRSPRQDVTSDNIKSLKAFCLRWCHGHGQFAPQDLDKDGNCPLCLEILTDLLDTMRDLSKVGGTPK